MKRLHVHVSVDDLPRSIRFYSTLFAAEPTVAKPDYAKWCWMIRASISLFRRAVDRPA